MDILDIVTNTWSMPMYLASIVGILILTLGLINFRLNRKIKSMVNNIKAYEDWSHRLYDWVVRELR